MGPGGADIASARCEVNFASNLSHSQRREAAAPPYREVTKEAFLFEQGMSCLIGNFRRKSEFCMLEDERLWGLWR